MFVISDDGYLQLLSDSRSLKHSRAHLLSDGLCCFRLKLVVSPPWILLFANATSAGHNPSHLRNDGCAIIPWIGDA
jgi:hypothetical protein